MSHVYRELKTLALAVLRSERSGHTLQATALVHETYLKILGGKEMRWESRIHFYTLAAKVMRRVLVDYARRRNTGKRGGGFDTISLDDSLMLSDRQCRTFSSLDEALNRLEALDARQAKVVELRFFGGLTEEDIAVVLGVSGRTVKRDWVTAKAWLHGQLSADD